MDLESAAAKIDSELSFRSASPWGTFADFLIAEKSGVFAGVTFEANDADIDKARKFDRFRETTAKFVSPDDDLHSKYPVVNLESGFLEIAWSLESQNRFSAAQCDDVCFGWLSRSIAPEWVGISQLDLYLEKYSVLPPGQPDVCCHLIIEKCA